jgi:hypothetical protein
VPLDEPSRELVALGKREPRFSEAHPSKSL